MEKSIDLNLNSKDLIDSSKMMKKKFKNIKKGGNPPYIIELSFKTSEENFKKLQSATLNAS